MTAKEFFKKIHAAERSVESTARKVEIFKSMAEKITSSLEGSGFSTSLAALRISSLPIWRSLSEANLIASGSC